MAASAGVADSQPLVAVQMKSWALVVEVVGPQVSSACQEALVGVLGGCHLWEQHTELHLGAHEGGSGQAQEAGEEV